MASRSLRLTDLPIPIISDVLWLAYQDMLLNDWLNLKMVCSSFFVEISRLSMSRNALDKEHKAAGMSLRRHWTSASLMPTSQYARYLSQKVLHYPGTVNPCFSRITFHVASVLMRHEQQSLRSLTGTHQLASRRREEIVYLLCRASVTATSNAQHLRDVPLQDLTLDFDTLAVSDVDFTIAAGAAYLGMIDLLADKTFPSVAWKELDSAAAKVYGDIFSAACRGGHVKVVRMLLERGNIPQPSHTTEAAREGNLEVVKLLIPPRTNGSLWDKCLALHRGKGESLGTYSLPQFEAVILAAVDNGHQRIVDLLVPAIVRPSPSFCTKFLAAAARNGYLELTRQAICVGADMNKQDGECMTPLDNACRKGHTEVVALLLELGASPVSSLEPMNQAAAGGHVDCMEQLLIAGVDINWRRGYFLIEPCSRGSANALKWLFENGFDITQASSENIYSATVYATKNGYTTILGMLLEHGVDWDIARKVVSDGNPWGFNIHHVSYFLDAYEENYKHRNNSRTHEVTQ